MGAYEEVDPSSLVLERCAKAAGTGYSVDCFARRVLDHSGLTAPASLAGREEAVGRMSGGRRFTLSSAAGRASGLRKCPVWMGETHWIDDHEGTVNQRLERLHVSETPGVSPLWDRQGSCSATAVEKPSAAHRLGLRFPSATGDKKNWAA